MAQIHWAFAGSGAFSLGSNWIGGVVPGPSDDAIFDAPGTTQYTVFASGQTVQSIQTRRNATLYVTGPAGLTVTEGTFNGFDDGTIDVAGSGASIVLSGEFNNQGNIKLSGTAAGGEAIDVVGTLVVKGGGRIKLNGGPATASIQDASGPSTFINGDDIIRGRGGLISTTTFDNMGGGQTLAVDISPATINNFGKIKWSGNITSGTLSNTGKVIAKSGGTITIHDPVSNSGVLEAYDGTLVLDGPVSGSGEVLIRGGPGPGAIELAAGVTPNVTFQNVTFNSGILEIADSQHYTGTIIGFPDNSAGGIDCLDIPFISGSTQVSFVEDPAIPSSCSACRTEPRARPSGSPATIRVRLSMQTRIPFQEEAGPSSPSIPPAPSPT